MGFDGMIVAATVVQDRRADNTNVGRRIWN
jgi:hypothetical protein